MAQTKEQIRQRAREYQAWYRASRTPEQQAADAAWHAAYRERNREKLRANARVRNLEYYATHQAERLAYNAAVYESRQEYIRAWRAANPERVKDTRARAIRKRRAKLAGSNSPGVTREQWAEIVESFGGQCAYCEKPATSCDHIEPIATGGLDAPDNVVPACMRCNRSKGAKSLPFWLLTSQYARDVTAGRPMIFSESDRATP